MKTREYHNPQNVPESNLKPGERFLLKEEVGKYEGSNCTMYYGNGKWGPENKAMGAWLDKTYKTTLPLPAEYREPDYSDPEYRKGVEQAFRDGKRIECGVNRVGNKCWGAKFADGFAWGDCSCIYRIHPDDIDKEIDWKTPEKQAEVRRMWAENPAMEREFSLGGKEWNKCTHDDWCVTTFYRPAQKPREKTEEELGEAAFADWSHSLYLANKVIHSYWEAFLAGVKYAREASRKGVA